MSESEDRTQTPSKHRRDQAREAGIVAHSPELTSAVGMLVAVGLIAVLGGSLISGLVELIRAPLVGTNDLSVGPLEFASLVRSQVLAVVIPLLCILVGAAFAAFLTHQAQVGGLWVPSRIAPDLSRLASGWPGMGAGMFDRLGRGLWGLAKATIVGAVAAWVITSRWTEFQTLGRLDSTSITQVCGAAVRALAGWLALSIVVLGLIDFAIQYARIESRLRMTPEESREDLRSNDGDPALRARRRKLAQGWRADPAEALVGASLVIAGVGGLTVVLGGGPPPKLITFRAIAKGSAGRRMRQAAETSGVLLHDGPELANQLALRRMPGQPMPIEVARELSAIWPPAI